MAAVMKTATAIGSVASFWSPKPAAIKSLKVYFEPKQAGEGDPSPDNARPIEGWTGVDLYKLKINDIVSDIWLSPDGKKAVGSLYNGFRTWSKSWYPTADMIGKTITYSAFINNENAQANSYVHVWTKKSDGSWYRVNIIPSYEDYTFAGSSGISSVTFTIDENMYEIDFGLTLPVGGYAKAPFVELGEYDATKSIKESIEFPENCYGGYVDLISGELTVTKAKYTLTGSEADGIAYNTTQNDPSGVERHYYWAKALDRVYVNNSSSTVLSNIGIGYIQSNREKKPPILIYVGTPSRQVGVYVTSSICEPTVESFCDYLNEHNIEIVNTLLNPVTHQLTPQQLSAFIGRNNFFSNATKVEVEYEYADSPELEVIKKRIALNEPHLSNASGSTANFYTDMASPMKSLKVNFEAKQSGSGDPSPDNVRPITGVDQVNVCRTGKNLCHIVGYSATTLTSPTNARAINNSYGTTLSTIDFTAPDTPVVITQSQTPNPESPNHYSNGYFAVIIDNLPFGKTYNISFRITDINNDPLDLAHNFDKLRLGRPNGSELRPTEINGDKLIYKNVLYQQNSRTPTAQHFYIRCFGASYTLSEFMVTAVDEEDQTFEPYEGDIIPCSFSELGTQYGGYVDLVNGELTVTWNKTSIKDTSVVKLEDSLTAAQNFQIFPPQQATIGFPTTTCPLICDTFMTLPQSGSSLSTRTNIVVWQSAVDGTFRVKTQEYCSLTANEFKEQFGDVQFVYQLRNPISYQLTPQQIKTFRGTNNIYSFDGTVDVKYWLHSDVKTERKTAQI